MGDAVGAEVLSCVVAPIEDRGLQFGVTNGFNTLRPVPVEIMDRDGPGGQPDGSLDYHDVDVSVYNIGGQLVGIYDMEDLTVFGTRYSNRYPDVILPYEQRNITPPGKAFGAYILIPHYEWATSNVPEDNDIWYSHWEQKLSEHAGDTWYEDGTTYVAFATDGNNNTVINYLFQYPFNASAGRHEGDLPNIRVTVNTQDPNIADIISVSYPIHGMSSVRTTKVEYNQSLAESFAGQTFNDDGNGNPAFANKYFAINQTHPVSFGGGYLEFDGVWGFGSHAQYPCPGKWHRTEVVISLDEFVVSGGLISLETVQFDFNDYQNIKLIPPRDSVVNNLRTDTNYNWLVFGGLWGHWRSLPTAGGGMLGIEDFLNYLTDILDFIPLPFIPFLPNLVEPPVTNGAPLSPYQGSLELP